MVSAHEPTPSSSDQILTLTRVEPEKNIARFYTLSIEPSLFGDHALVRRWGRIGCRGRLRIDLHASRLDAEKAFRQLASIKRKRRYR
jgi:Uncharacterized conserved protein